MDKILIVLISIFVLIVCAMGAVYYVLSDKPSVNIEDTKIPTINVNYMNFAEVISENNIVQDLPSDAVLQLKFYNYNSGSQAWEKSFVMKKGSVVEDDVDEADIVLSLNSKYLNELTNKNFCDVIKEANANGDLGFESSLSTAGLAWKFKSVMKYKDCFGM
jgi:flagellar basal body-associated protein FliL